MVVSVKETYALYALGLYSPKPGEEAGAQRHLKSRKGVESWDRGTLSLRTAWRKAAM